MIICFIVAMYYHTNKIRTIVNEVRFDENKLQIIGQDFNSKYEDNLDLSKTMIEIQLEELGKTKADIVWKSTVMRNTIISINSTIGNTIHLRNC
jgi:thiamine biosynthesis protein ThiC